MTFLTASWSAKQIETTSYGFCSFTLPFFWGGEVGATAQSLLGVKDISPLKKDGVKGKLGSLR